MCSKSNTRSDGQGIDLYSFSGVFGAKSKYNKSFVVVRNPCHIGIWRVGFFGLEKQIVVLVRVPYRSYKGDEYESFQELNNLLQEAASLVVRSIQVSDLSKFKA